jgi:hypothetical protein
MNDRHRCEIMWIAHIPYTVAYTIHRNYPNEENQKWWDVAYEAKKEPLEGVDPEKRRKIIDRVQRMSDKTLVPISGKTNMVKVVLLAYCIIETLIDEGLLTIPEDSALSRLMEHLLSQVDMEEEATQKQLASARKQSAKWLEMLRKEGYFR